MDSKMPPRRLEVLQEKIDSWREAEAKATERYCNLIDVMTDVADNIDGHPAEAVKVLGQVRGDIERMEQRLISGTAGRGNEGDGGINVLKVIGIMLSWIVSSGIGVVVGMAIAGG